MSCPVYGGVHISEVSNVHMSMQGNTSVLLKEVAAIISEVSFNRGFPVCTF